MANPLDIRIPAKEWDCVQQAADRKLALFLELYPDVAHAETGHFGQFKSCNVIVVANGDEWTGYGSTLVAARADALVKAKGPQPAGLPGNEFRVWRMDDRELERHSKAQRAYVRGGLAA